MSSYLKYIKKSREGQAMLLISVLGTIANIYLFLNPNWRF